MEQKSYFKEEQNPIQVADKIFAVLEELASDGPLALTEISQRVMLNKTTVHRVLNSLIYMGYAKQDGVTGKYDLGFKICDVAGYVLNKLDVVGSIRPFLKELLRVSEETVHLVQLESTYAVYIDKIESQTNSIRLVSRTGKSLPLYCSGVGKAMLAQMQDTDIERFWKQEEIRPVTPHTITDFDAFMEEIEIVRKKGYALDNEENEMGVRCIAIAVEGVNDALKYGISISAPIQRMDDARIIYLAEHMLEAKRRICDYFKS